MSNCPPIPFVRILDDPADDDVSLVGGFGHRANITNKPLGMKGYSPVKAYNLPVRGGPEGIVSPLYHRGHHGALASLL